METEFFSGSERSRLYALKSMTVPAFRVLPKFIRNTGHWLFVQVIRIAYWPPSVGAKMPASA